MRLVRGTINSEVILEDSKREGAWQHEYQGFKTLVSPTRDFGLAFIDDTTLVFGAVAEGIQPVLGIARLSPNPPKDGLGDRP